jgi:hypothetical protein
MRKEIKTVKEILRKYLYQYGYDGLADGDGKVCGCGLDCLIACDDNPGKCVPAYANDRVDCGICGAGCREEFDDVEEIVYCTRKPER